MSNKNLARRIDIMVTIAGSDVSSDVNKYLQSLTYTDNEEDKADDLQITLDDREGIWIKSWLKNISANESGQQTNTTNSTSANKYNIGDEVIANGQPKYTSYGTRPGQSLSNYKGKITHLNLKDEVPYPIHIDQKGWFAESEITIQTANADKSYSGIKGIEIQAVIIQKNWDSDGKDEVLDCGSFEVDSIDVQGPPTKLSIKSTSIPYTTTTRTQTKTKAWENIKLSKIANEIATQNGMKCMFESSYDPLYVRKEQVQQSDIVFLSNLCKSAGISLKVTAKTIVLFDAKTYEDKPPIREVKNGSSDVLTYSFGTSSNDTSYSSCHVSYTDPNTKETIEYTYKPENSDGTGQVLEINEKVNNKEEARQLAMKRLRQKNKAEFSASFSIVGDVTMVAGVTVNVIGWGIFDGKYIVESATHNVTGGYKTNIKLRKVLEEY